MVTLKTLVCKIACHRYICYLIRWVFKNKIPHQNSRIETPTFGDSKVCGLLFWGLYERDEVILISRYLNGNAPIIELGSSIGAVSCILGNKIEIGQELICVEANPQLIALLTRNIELNCPGKTARILHGAIHYGPNHLVNFSVGETNLTSKVEVASGPSGSLVPVLKLSDIVSSRKFTEFTLICDIEGAEIEILKEDSKVFEHCVMLIIELHVTSYRGSEFPVFALIDLIHELTPLRRIAQRGDVCVFTRP